jgi:predicted nucleotidyltransferase
MMADRNDILLMIQESVKASEPDATIILYGSYARGDYRKDSDVDLLILLDKDKVTREDEKKLNILYTTSSLIPAGSSVLLFYRRMIGNQNTR